MVAQSPEPGAHLLNARAFRIESEFRNVGFCGEGKTEVPREKPLGEEKRTNNKLNPHMTSSAGIEPGPHWWKASALTTATSLLRNVCTPYYPSYVCKFTCDTCQRRLLHLLLLLRFPRLLHLLRLLRLLRSTCCACYSTFAILVAL